MKSFPTTVFVHLRAAALSTFMSCAALGSQAATWQIVNEAEMLEYGGPQGFDAPAPLRTRSVQPSIELISPVPSQDGKVNVPFPIQVKFLTTAGSFIRPDTLRILYGAMKFDVTDRMRALIQITPNGFQVDNADIPKGKHRLLIQVKDDKDRVAEKDIRLQVE
ncbi:MAG TPA: hypothetical protein PK347_05680 [Burkholderiaceae bacterium]|nr:hypothetical protein [Burkholderiaceae bacterium]